MIRTALFILVLELAVIGLWCGWQKRKKQPAMGV